MQAQNTYKAIGVTGKGGVETLKELTLPKPVLRPKDILVKVKGFALNPVDYKVRDGLFNAATEENPQVLGYDASGEVIELGSEVKGFKVGDHVYYSGDVSRNGNAGELHAVDHRIVGKKPSKLSFAEAASFPLVWITTYEALIERMQIPIDKQANKGKSILITAGAGGVGSIATQVAKNVLGLTVTATASRPETIEFVKKHGADYVINHRNPLRKEIEAQKLPDFDYVFHCADLTDDYLQQLTDITKPFGKISFISPTPQVNLTSSFSKVQTVLPEMMFGRIVYDHEPEKQGESLDFGAKLLNEGVLVHTASKIEKFSLQSIKEGQELLASGKTIGKLAYSLD